MAQAKLLDLEEEPTGAPETEEEVTLQAVEEQEPETPKEDDIPEKYQGKSVKELVQMHQEAEKAMGRQGSEVGELRKIVDGYIREQLVETAPPPKQAEPEEEVDWFTDPDKALEKKLESHPAIKALEQAEQRNTQQASQAALESKHPDYREICQDGQFIDWIKESKTRQRLFIEADQQYNADSADELFSTWKERKKLAEVHVDADKASRQEELKKASTGDTRGSGAPAAKKKYRRSDIINLAVNDPERYQQLAPEILLAYKEKRVI